MSTRDIKFQKQNRRIPYISRLLRFWYCLYTQVVSAVEVVPSRFHVIVVPTIAERVYGSDGGRQAARHGQHFPPSVVRIAYHFHAVRVHDPQYVALYILMVPVLHAVVLHSYRQAICVVHIVDRPYYIARFLILLF